MKRIATILTLLVGAMFATAAIAQDDMGAVPATVVDVAVDNEDFSMLVQALQTAGLVETLQGEGPFTVFAPTNEAFEELADELGLTVEEVLAREDLADILTYHVVPGAYTSTDLLEELEGEDDGEITVETVEGSELVVSERIEDQLYLDGSAHLTTIDIEAGNGWVHVIDEVLMPSNGDTETTD